MDPNAALSAIREAMRIMSIGDVDPQDYADAAATLHENTEALDGWLSRGGFLPDAWQPKSAPREQTWACCTSSIGPTCQHKSED